jgi:hypothetical protein
MDEIIIEKFNLCEQYVNFSRKKLNISLLLTAEMVD